MPESRIAERFLAIGATIFIVIGVLGAGCHIVSTVQIEGERKATVQHLDELANRQYHLLEYDRIELSPLRGDVYIASHGRREMRITDPHQFLTGIVDKHPVIYVNGNADVCAAWKRAVYDLDPQEMRYMDPTTCATAPVP